MTRQLTFSPIGRGEARARWERGATIAVTQDRYESGLTGHGIDRNGMGGITFDTLVERSTDTRRPRSVFWYAPDDDQEALGQLGHALIDAGEALEHLTCSETDAIALALAKLGQQEAAQSVLIAHSYCEDDQELDYRHRGLLTDLGGYQGGDMDAVDTYIAELLAGIDHEDEVPDQPQCIDPTGNRHEHCPLHGCVEYVCCIPTVVDPTTGGPS